MVSVCSESSERGRLGAFLPPRAGELLRGLVLRDPGSAWGGGKTRNPAPGERGSRGRPCWGHACAVAGVAGPEVRGWRRCCGLGPPQPRAPFFPEKVNRGVSGLNDELTV